VVLGQARWKFIKAMLDEIAEKIRVAKEGTYTFIEIPLQSRSET